MAAVLPTSAKRTNKGRLCRATAFIRNNNVADRLTASWSAMEKQENERNECDPELCGGFSLRGRRVVELLNAVAIWPVTGQGFQNTKWPAVLYSQ